MQRCHQCESPLTATEKQCYMCGTPVLDKNHIKKPFSERFRVIVNALFLISLVVVVTSILAPSYSPSLWKTIPGFVVMYFVRNSANSMAEASNGDSGPANGAKKS
ncbi:MAG: hypothetical protein ABL995_05760 [Bryobacteraceae bacterium]